MTGAQIDVTNKCINYYKVTDGAAEWKKIANDANVYNANDSVHIKITVDKFGDGSKVEVTLNGNTFESPIGKKADETIINDKIRILLNNGSAGTSHTVKLDNIKLTNTANQYVIKANIKGDEKTITKYNKNETVEAVAKVYCNQPSATATMVFAKYNASGVLTGAKVGSVKNITQNGEIKLELTAGAEDTTMRAFIFDSLSNIKPFIDEEVVLTQYGESET